MAKGPAPATTPTDTTTQTAAATNAERVTPLIAAVRTDVAAPVKKRAGGATSISAYKAAFDSLPAPTAEGVQASFGVVNKTKRQMQGTVSGFNRKSFEPKKDANGNVVYKVKELTDSEGNVTRLPTQEPELVATRHFIVVETDPKTDPDGATARVYRDL